MVDDGFEPQKKYRMARVNAKALGFNQEWRTD